MLEAIQSNTRRAKKASKHIKRTQTTIIHEFIGATEARRRSIFETIPEHERAYVTRNLNNSFLTVDSDGIIQPKTAEGALISIGAYLQAGKPPAGDPAEARYLQQMKALEITARELDDG